MVMTKKEIIKILMEQYNYSEEDLQQDDGSFLLKADLEALLEKEEALASQMEDIASKEVTVNPLDFVDETVVKKDYTINDNDLIVCMSGVAGEYVFVSPLSNFRTSTRDFGQTMKIPYKDLVYVHNMIPHVFENGTIIVLNEQVQEEFGLKEIYENVITPKNVDNVLSMEAKDLERFIDNMPRAMHQALFHRARERYASGKLDSVSKINIIQNKLGISLEDNQPVADRVKE